MFWLLSLTAALLSVQVEGQTGYQMNCLVNGRYILSNKRSDGNLIAYNERVRYANDTNPFRYGYSFCVGAEPSNPWSGCGMVGKELTSESIFTSRLSGDDSNRLRFKTPQELDALGLLNSIVKIEPISGSANTYLRRTDTQFVEFRVIGSMTGRDAWEIHYCADGAMCIRSMSTDAGWTGQALGFFSNGDIAAYSLPLTLDPSRWHFYLQPTVEADGNTFYLVNRKYCTALGFNGQSQNAVDSSSRSTAQKMKITVVAQPSNSWPDTQFTRSVLTKTTNQMFDRCNWLVAYEDTHPRTTDPLYSVRNSRGNLVVRQSSSTTGSGGSDYNLNSGAAISDNSVRIVLRGDGKMVARLGTSTLWSFGGQTGVDFSVPESCYCNPGWCWQDGTSFCLLCGNGEYQDKSEATTGVLNTCTSVLPTTVIAYPYNAPVGACKKIDRGCYGGRGSTSSCPNEIPAGCADYADVNARTSVSCPVQCPAGSYSSARSTSCTKCPAGFYSPLPRANSSATCQPCASGYYSSEGATTCTACNKQAGRGFYASVGGLKDTCQCAAGYTGDFCDIRECSALLPSGSLLSLLFNADTALRAYSAAFQANAVDKERAVRQTLLDILQHDVDLNGNGLISASEVISALATRSIYTSGMQNLSIWSSDASASAVQHHYDVALSVVIEDAMNNYRTSPKHTFDGSGVAELVGLFSTYPNATWDINTCKKYDHGIYKATALNVLTDWATKATTVPNTILLKTCGYINGIKSPQFTVDAVLNGSRTEFTDNGAISTDNQFKRVYCVALHFVTGCTNPPACTTNTAYNIRWECAVGLIYDGTPVDLRPTLTTHGVVFSYLDTSSAEYEFDIFSGTYLSNQEAKAFVIGIPYASTNCGRESSHISFADNKNSALVGQIVEYGIRALQRNASNAEKLSSMSVARYRIPFLSSIEGTVRTASGAGVPSVDVTVCRIDPETNANDPRFCPLQVFSTDKRGLFSGEIRVSDIVWNNTIEYFNVSASKVEELLDGSEIDHVFVPSSQIVSLNHLREGMSLSIMDNTSIAIYGKIGFDPAFIDGLQCPFVGVPVVMVDGNGKETTTTAGPDGTFTFTITRGTNVQVYIPDYQGHTWRSTVSTWSNRWDLSSTSPSRRRLQATVTPTRAPTRAPSGPTKLPTPGPSTVTPTFSPTVVPTFSPTVVPTFSPTIEPTLSPTVSPSTASPSTVAPSPQPTTFRPSVIFIEDDEPHLLQLYKFDVNATLSSGLLVTNDTVFGHSAEMMNVQLVDGGVVFGGTEPSYLQLPSRSLNPAYKKVTVELWVTVEPTTPANAVLFSFGAPDNEARCAVTASAFLGVISAHVVVICDGVANKAFVYLNGELIAQQILVVDTPVEVGRHDFIGRDGSGSSPALRGRMEEFRIYYSSLSPEVIYSNFLSGFDQSRVKFAPANTQGNIELNFFATTRQLITLNVFGGIDPATRMFGSETSFMLSAAGPMCSFALNVSLENNGESSVTVLASAMNYTVTMVTAPEEAPAFAESACVPGSPGLCVCDDSLPPSEYFALAEQTAQAVTIVAANDAEYTVTYTYRSGLCMVMPGTESFSKVEGNLTVMPGESCFAASSTVMKEGEKATVRVVLFERYPSTPAWLAQGSPFEDGGAYDTSYLVGDDARLYVTDLVSGKGDLQDIPYNSTMVFASAAANVKTPVAVTYQITASDPQTAGSMNWLFSVVAQRLSPGPPSTVTAERYIPIIGVIPKEVPNVYPVSTNADMIFLVIRDPPGGASQTIIHAGTTTSFAMSIEGLETDNDVNTVTYSFGSGEEADLRVWQGIGAGVMNKLLSAVSEYKVEQAVHFEKSTERLNSDSFALSFTFQYDFATSLDPFIAGHPSDVIVGGGVDLIVSEALVGKLPLSSPPIDVSDQLVVEVGKAPSAQWTCVQLNESYVWQPARVTTFVLPVIEIEQLIVELQRIVDSNTITVQVRTQVQGEIDNWRSILTKYRSYNDKVKQQVRMFNEMDKQWNNIVNGLANGDAKAFDKHYMESLSLTSFAEAYNNYVKYCDGNSYRTAYVFEKDAADLCSTFKRKDWARAATTIEGMCRSNAASQSSMFKQFCITGSVSSSQVPGGLAGGGDGGQSMFGFLSDSTKLLTFSANAPMTIAWTTGTTDSNGVGKSKSISSGVTTAVGFTFGFGGVVTKELKLAWNGDFSNGVNNVTSSTNEQSVERTITVVLDDADQGDYFAVRMTEDPVYGTPIFFTVGGESKCPGETGTSRRESNVRINRIVHRCGADRKSICDELTLINPDDTAHFGVVIQNLSPTEDEVSYTVGLASSFDEYHGNGYRDDAAAGHCGTAGQRSGLVAEFMETELDGIPFNVEIEVPFTVSKSDLCSNFVDIAVTITATCEMGSSSSSVYQYGVAYDSSTRTTTTSYDPANVIKAAEDTALFSVKWATPSRRLDESVRSAVGDGNTQDLQALLQGQAELMDQLNTLHIVIFLLAAVVAVQIVWQMLSKNTEKSAFLGN